MTLDDKRKVIEVLLCAGDPDEADSICDLMDASDDESVRISSAASAARREISRDRHGHGGMLVSCDTYEDDCLCAAYRLIESSPTLRKEWFGKGTP